MQCGATKLCKSGSKGNLKSKIYIIALQMHSIIPPCHLNEQKNDTGKLLNKKE